jgi:hypothetical protein
MPPEPDEAELVRPRIAATSQEHPLRVDLNINLRALQGMAQRRLQRLVDIIEVSHAGVRGVTDAHYPAAPAFLSVYPSHNTRLDAAGARSAAQDWFTLHCLRDAVEVISLFLEESRRCCALFALSKKRHIRFHELQAVDRDSDRFHSEGLPKKFRWLSDSYGVRSDFTEHIITVNAARNCLVHRDGVVAPKDVEEPSKLLIVRWLAVRIDVVSPDGKVTRTMSEPGPVDEGWMVHVVTAPTSKSFPVGAQIRFTHEDLAGILLSHLMCVNTIASSVQQYAESLGFTFPPAPQQSTPTGIGGQPSHESGSPSEVTPA